MPGLSLAVVGIYCVPPLRAAGRILNLPLDSSLRLRYGGDMQCKDLPDELVVGAISATPGHWRDWEDVLAHLPGVPYNVLVAKIRRLERRGVVHACVHSGKIQCRGDLHLPDECKGC